MKITSVKAIPASATNPGVRNYVFVKVETDEGITGWGEATCGPLAVATMVDEFGNALVGANPMEIERHWQMLYHHFHVRGGIIQMSAISGIEIALWDIKGQALGVPVYELLGGKLRDRIWTYGRWDGPTVEQSVENAMNHVDQGLTALKGDPFEHRGIFIDRASEDLAVEKMIYNKKKYDSLISAVKSKYMMWRKKGKLIYPHNFRPKTRPRCQDIKDREYIENGCFYIFRRDNFFKHKRYIAKIIWRVYLIYDSHKLWGYTSHP